MQQGRRKARASEPELSPTEGKRRFTSTSAAAMWRRARLGEIAGNAEPAPGPQSRSPVSGYSSAVRPAWIQEWRASSRKMYKRLDQPIEALGLGGEAGGQTRGCPATGRGVRGPPADGRRRGGGKMRYDLDIAVGHGPMHQP